MAQFDFDRVIDRAEWNHAAKFDERDKKFGRADVIPLWVADMDFQTAPCVIDALVSRAKEGIWGYTSRPDSYFEAVRDWQQKRNGWSPDTRLMSHSLGVVPALSVIVRNFTSEGAGVLIQTPVYSEFYDVVQAWDRRVVESPLVYRDGVWQMDFADFEKKLEEVEMFLLCSPHNPVGRVWTQQELVRMLDACFRHNVRVVSDEIHSDLTLFGNRHIPTASISPEAEQSVITCLSASKTFNLAGLQASITLFPDAQQKRVFDDFWMKMDIHRNNAFSLIAVETALRGGEEWLEALKTYLEGNLHFVKDYCDAHIPRIHVDLPQATYLLWLDCRGLCLDHDQLNSFMVEKAGLGLNDGRSFAHGLDGYMRLNAGCSRSVLEQAMRQLKDAVDAL